MAKSHPARFNDYGMTRCPQRTRGTVGSSLLLACLVSLGIVLHNQYDNRFPAAVMDRLAALDLAQLVPPAEPTPAVDPSLGKYRAVGEYLGRRYRVSSDVTTHIVAKAHTVGLELKLDPMLILAVISVESRFNPIAESTMGAKGLMQVIPRYHPEKFDALGGEKMAFEPEANILIGARILKDYLRRTGDLVDALQMYVGATSDGSDNGYSTKVMTERDRLKHVLQRYQARITAAPRQPQHAEKQAASAI